MLDSGFSSQKKIDVYQAFRFFVDFSHYFCNLRKGSDLRFCSKHFQANDKGRVPNLAQITTFRKIAKNMRKIDEKSKSLIHVYFFLWRKPRIKHPFPPIPELKNYFWRPIFARRPLHGPQSDPWIMKHLLESSARPQSEVPEGSKFPTPDLLRGWHWSSSRWLTCGRAGHSRDLQRSRSQR